MTPAAATPYETLIAMKRLKTEGIWYDKLTPFHLKVGRYNFWPKRGRIHIDGQTAPVTRGGLETFVNLIKADGSVMASLRHNAGNDSKTIDINLSDP
jgi:hypothetical protein